MIPRIRHVQIKNYKSLEAVSVQLEPFTVFVGPNGSGKSNFLDAIAFVQDCVSESVELAFRKRGGIDSVLCRHVDRRQFLKVWNDPPDTSAIPDSSHLGIHLVMDLDDNRSADYAFEIGRVTWQSFRVARERCEIRSVSGATVQFDVQDGQFKQSLRDVNPVVLDDRLQLPLLAGMKDVRPLWDFIDAIRTYSIVPERLRELQSPDSGRFLKPDGRNAVSVLRKIRGSSPDGAGRYNRIVRLLSHVAEGVSRIVPQQLGDKETVEFVQELGPTGARSFDAREMSDGTLRVLGLLLAVLQPFPKVVGIEEPEATVHPAISEMIMEVLMDAAEEKQVLITTHSPDLLDQKELKDDQIRVVSLRNGRTVIAPMSEGDRQAVRERLYSPGELLRMGELNADETGRDESPKKIDLFGEPFLI